MRTLAILTALMFLAACENETAGPVDPNKLPPLSGQEQVLLTAAEANLRQGNVARAEKNYLSAVSVSKGRIESHLLLAQFYLDQKQPEKAADIVKRGAVYQPEHPRLAYIEGKIALQQNQPEAALAAFEHGLKNQPSDGDLLSGAGVANDMLRRHAAAQVLYLRALGLNPEGDTGALRANLSMSYILSGKSQEAVNLLTKKPVPDVSITERHNLALAYGVLGQHDKARALLKGEMTEEARLQSIARVKSYVAGK
jgi:Flp pilus assembly protein TadD